MGITYIALTMVAIAAIVEGFVIYRLSSSYKEAESYHKRVNQQNTKIHDN